VRIPLQSDSLLALIDQHAADERYRLERIVSDLSTLSHKLDPRIEFPVLDAALAVLSRRRENLFIWGVRLVITSSTIQVTHVPAVLCAVDSARWKAVLTGYVSSQAAGDMPAGIMDMLCSKACRSVTTLFWTGDDVVGGDV